MKKNCCVFEHQKECPVRKVLSNKQKTINKLDKIIKPMGDQEKIKIFMPLLDKMQEAFSNEFQILHYYCEICRKVKK